MSLLSAYNSENFQLKKELTELKKYGGSSSFFNVHVLIFLPLFTHDRLTSPSYTSRKRHRDIRPGDITHVDLQEMYQKYYDTKYRHLLAEQNFKSKESRCDFLSGVLKVPFTTDSHLCSNEAMMYTYVGGL